MAFIRSYAAVEAIGRLGRDAQIRTTSSENSSPLFLLPSLNAQGKKAPKRRSGST